MISPIYHAAGSTVYLRAHYKTKPGKTQHKCRVFYYFTQQSCDYLLCFSAKLYFTPKVNYGAYHFVKFSSTKKYQKSKIFTIFYYIKFDKIAPSFSYLRKISFGGKTKVFRTGTTYPQSDTEHLTTLLTSKLLQL